MPVHKKWSLLEVQKYRTRATTAGARTTIAMPVNWYCYELGGATRATTTNAINGIADIVICAPRATTICEYGN